MSAVHRAPKDPASTSDAPYPRMRWLAGWSGTYLAIAIAATWPVARVLTSHVPHDLGDPLLSLTLLQWNAKTALFTSQWWNGVGFYPLTNTITLSDPRLGASLISTPIIWITGSAPAAYNVVFVLSYACSALAAHALVRRLTGSDAAAVIAGCAFGFSPFRTAHMAHLELLLAWWMPVALVAAHGWLATRRRGWLAVLAMAVAAQGLFAAYYLPMIGVLLALWALWFAAGRVPVGQFAQLTAAVVSGGAALAPLFLYYWHAHQALDVSRGIGEIQRYSADVSSIWSAGLDVRLWPSFEQENPERYLFPGLTVLLLALWYACAHGVVTVSSRPVRVTRRVLVAIALAALAAALVSHAHGPWRLELAGARLLVSQFRKPLSVGIAALTCAALLTDRVQSAMRTRSIGAFYLLASCVMFVLALGPDPTFLGVRFLYKAPYSWLMLAPGFEGSMRAPARFGMVMALTLAVAAGLAWHHLTRRLPTGRVRWLTLVIGTLILADGWAAPLRVVAVPQAIEWPSPCATLPRLELPLGDAYADAAAQYRAMLDGTRAVNGLSGYMPPHTAALIFALRARDADAVAALAEHGPLCVGSDRSRTSADMVQWLSTHPLVEPLGMTAAHAFLLIRRASPALSGATGAPVDIAAAASDSGSIALAALTDRVRATMWVTGEWQRPGQSLRLTLACPAIVESVGLLQDGGRFARRLAVDVSADGTNWRQAWEGTTGGLVVRSALRDPKWPWIQLPLGKQDARAVRLRIVAGGVPTEWAVAEVEVHGACAPVPLD